MLDGLAAFVEGRIERRFWSPRDDLDVRKLAAIEALSRHGRAQARMLGSIKLTPNLWPTAAVIDWFNILKRVPGVPDQAKRLAEAQQILRSRLTYAGTTLRFSNEADDFWWWLMDSADANAARLILAVLDEPGWKDEIPRMVVGSLARQRGGAWLTTAKLWGSLALDKFSAGSRRNRWPARRTPAWVARWPASTAAATGWRAATLAGQRAGHAERGARRHGTPWLTVQSWPPSAEGAAARGLQRHAQRDGGGAEGQTPVVACDVLRVRVEIDAQSDMTWVG